LMTTTGGGDAIPSDEFIGACCIAGSNRLTQQVKNQATPKTEWLFWFTRAVFDLRRRDGGSVLARGLLLGQAVQRAEPPH
jgi:hypothetical protein